MAFIKWTQSFSVGVKLIDNQHKKLFLLINNLYDAKEKGEKSFESLDAVIQDMMAYIDFHFRTEEKYFDEFGYGEKEIHKKEHKFYEDKINNFHVRYMDKKSELSEEIIYFLKDWIQNHIKISDKKYAKCFNEHGLI